MHITLLAVGRLKEKYLQLAQEEYLKRLRLYAKVEVVEVADEPHGEGLSPAGEDAVKEKEMLRLKKFIKNETCLVVLDREGLALSSEGFSGWLGDQGLHGKSHVTFIIGGSLGLHYEITRQAAMRLSFSSFTFPHQLMRVILLEQIYRGFKILKGEPYHK